MRRVVAAVSLVAFGFLAGLAVSGRMRATEQAPGALEGPAAAPVPAAAAMGTAPIAPDFSAVAGSAVRAVTSISSAQVGRPSPFASDPFFRYFFGDDQDLFGWRERPTLGSGVVVAPDGYVLTNAHVIGNGAREIVVGLSDQREMMARVVGMDTLTDLALLKVNTTGLATVPWGDSSQLKVAEWVLAVGNPYQLSQTVTLGIISAVGRRNVGIAGYEDFIQTDAAINPGNSGGALLNARGQLVGINTAIFSESGGYQGIGFAIPSNLARRVMNDLTRYGEVRRGSLGYMEVAPVTSRLGEELGLPAARGALVTRMARDSAAYAAGVRPGDVIVTFDGTTVDDPAEFLRLLSDASVGRTVTLGLIREGREIQVRAVVARASPRSRR